MYFLNLFSASTLPKMEKIIGMSGPLESPYKAILIGENNSCPLIPNSLPISKRSSQRAPLLFRQN